MKKILCLLLLANFFMIICSCNNNQSKYDSWYLNKMKIDKLWEYSKGDTQTIAFIDTGITDELANTLSEKIVYKYNIFEKNDNVSDIHGHGTEIVSVACSNGYKNVFGIAPNAKIIILKAVSDEGKTNNNNLYSALKIAQNKGATIVNISLGGYKSDEKVINQINSMIDDNITIVAAAGDYQNKDLLFPANQKNVISVEALDSNFKLWKNSNHSDKSIIRMPGVGIDVLSLDSNGVLYRPTVDGTSQAASITSAYIALIRDYFEKEEISYDNNTIISVLNSLNTKEEKQKIDFSIPFKK